MQRKDFSRRYELHECDQIIVVRIVAQRKSSVTLVTKPAPGIKSPTRDDGGADVSKVRHQDGAIGVGRKDQNIVLGTSWREQFVIWESNSKHLVDVCHLGNGLVKHDRQASLRQ